MSVCGRPKFNLDKYKYIQKYINTKVDINRTMPFGFTSSIDKNGNTNIYTHGKRNIEEDLPFESNSIYRMASQSKFMGVTGFLKLIDKGLTTWDTPLSTYLPEFSKENMGVIEPYNPNIYTKTLLNPISTVIGSNIIHIRHRGHNFNDNQTVSLEWANGSMNIGKTVIPDGNGIPGFELFNIHTINNVTENGYDITLSTPANKTGTTGSFVKILSVCPGTRRSICLKPDKMLINPKVVTHYYKIKPLNRELTILDVLNHGLGWSYYSSSMLYMSFGYSKHQILSEIQAGIWNEIGIPVGAPITDNDSDIKNWVKTAAKIPLLYQPGEDWSYGPQLSILGALIEIIDGRPVEQYLKEELWYPLGMKDTGFFIHDNDPDYNDKVFRISKLYINMPKIVMKFVNKDIFSSLPIEGAEYCLYKGFKKLALIDCGMYTTVENYLQFMKMYLNRGKSDTGVVILSEDMINIISKYSVSYDVTNLSTINEHSSGLSIPISGYKSDIKRERLLTAMKWGLGVGTIQGCKNNPYVEENQDNIDNDILAITWAGVLGTRFLIDFCSGVAYNVGTNVIGPPAGTVDSDLIELNYKEMSKDGYMKMIKEILL
jgi:CubicO group peptidase (beta-lactamase class C family)